jgi:hypothetical protein
MMAGKILSHTAERTGTIEGFGKKKTPEDNLGIPPYIGLTNPPPAPGPALNQFGTGLPGRPPQFVHPLPTWS